MKLEDAKKILNSNVKGKYTDEQVKLIYATIQQLVQIDIKRIKE